LISDIDRGGVFAHIVGTLALLSKSEQARVKGFIINKFRGSLELLQEGLDWLTESTQKPVFGVLPFLHNLKLDAEDAIRINQNTEGSINIKVAVFSRISNHTDFDPLAAHPEVNLTFVGAADELTGADLIILPGSKNVRAEMKLMTDYGWLKPIKQHLRYGGKLLGICGGFQLLGKSISDPLGIEDSPGDTRALGLLNFKTELKEHKQLKNVCGHILLNNSEHTLTGYEIHCGISEGIALNQPFAKIHDANGSYFDGAISDDNQIAGTYIHGLFEKAESLNALLKWVTGESILAEDWQKTRLAEIERLTDGFEENLNVDQLIRVMR
jgi:adenosylcobyric acid synthase